ncbi:MAG TPA: Hsp70 family protein [Roseiarcus sp.]|jgi:hypothetical chaperone protein
MTPTAIGVDFGTTNSVVAIADASGNVVARRFETLSGPVETFRSALLFFRQGQPPNAEVSHVSGPDALTRALDVDGEHRFLQSLKTHLSSKVFQDTRLFGRRYSLEELIGVFLNDLLPKELRGLPIVSGRPVVFAGDRANEALAVERLDAAFRHAGAGEVEFAYEPLGAAYWYGRRLTSPETVLVADFGGGTSDFSVMRFDPTGGKLRAEALSHAGVGVAGDTFDFRILDHVVSPRLGKGSQYRSFDKLLPLPAHYFAAFAQWHRLSLLKNAVAMAELRRLVKQAEKPDQIRDLIEVVELDLGYELYLAVSKLKVRLSTEAEAPFRFAAEGLDISAEVRRADFEQWIADDVAKIAATIDLALERAGMASSDIDAVFMTGGTSFVPAVRRLFDTRFGQDKLHYGDAFNSVASGLALIAADRATAG